MAKDSGKQQGEDLELTPDKASDVKGGLLPSEPGGSTARHVTAKKHKTKHSIQGPSGGMTHK